MAVAGGDRGGALRPPRLRGSPRVFCHQIGSYLGGPPFPECTDRQAQPFLPRPASSTSRPHATLYGVVDGQRDHGVVDGGRHFPVFERDGFMFGVVICADGGYVEPSRILALKGRG